MNPVLRMRFLRHYHRIMHVLAKHQLEYLMIKAGLDFLMPARLRKNAKEKYHSAKYNRASEFIEALVELGPTFIKLGQMLSTRPDLLPADYIEELESLQDKVDPFPYEQVIEQISNELGNPHEIFRYFDPQPLAAASIGQVHRATLKTGEEVIVKVQRPNIEKTIHRDLEFLCNLSVLAERYSEDARQIGTRGIVSEYARILKMELDYDREAKNTERMRKNFNGNETVLIPKVFWDYTTPKVLTEEYIPGVKFNDLEEIDKRGWDRKKVSAMGTESFLTQIVLHGFFQADPHPGNMIIVDEDHVAFIDFGEMGSLTGDRLRNLSSLFLALSNRDTEQTMAVFSDMGIVTEKVDYDAFTDDLVDLINKVYEAKIGSIDVSKIRKEFMDLSFRYRLKVPVYITTLLKALIIVEGVGTKLDPEFNFTQVMEKLSKNVLDSHLSGRKVYEIARRKYYREIRPVMSLPMHITQLVKTAKDGEMQVNIQMGFDKRTSTKLTQLTGRLGSSLIIAGGMIGSALIMVGAGEHAVAPYATLGLAGFIISLVALVAFLLSAYRII